MKNSKQDGLPNHETTIPLAEGVYQALLDAIYQGELPPGSVINEVTLAQKYGVSRGPVREAIRRLEGIQLITREPYMKARVMTLSAAAVLELFQLRMALEGMACYLATKRMSKIEIDHLQSELEQHQTRNEDKVFDFHERIVQSCGNNRIINALCGDLYHLLRLYRRFSGTVKERKEEAYAEHWQILRAMKAGDPVLAESLMRSHIERVINNLTQRLS